MSFLGLVCWIACGTSPILCVFERACGGDQKKGGSNGRAGPTNTYNPKWYFNNKLAEQTATQTLVTVKNVLPIRCPAPRPGPPSLRLEGRPLIGGNRSSVTIFWSLLPLSLPVLLRVQSNYVFGWTPSLVSLMPPQCHQARIPPTTGTPATAVHSLRQTMTALCCRALPHNRHGISPVSTLHLS